MPVIINEIVIVTKVERADTTEKREPTKPVTQPQSEELVQQVVERVLEEIRKKKER